MTPHRFKRHFQFGTWLPVRLLKSVELPVSPADKEQIAYGNAERLLHL
jgi:predicted TIM-barrel fold metal-dependent hydrolase